MTDINLILEQENSLLLLYELFLNMGITEVIEVYKNIDQDHFIRAGEIYNKARDAYSSYLYNKSIEEQDMLTTTSLLQVSNILLMLFIRYLSYDANNYLSNKQKLIALMVKYNSSMHKKTEELKNIIKITTGIPMKTFHLFQVLYLFKEYLYPEIIFYEYLAYYLAKYVIINIDKEQDFISILNKLQ